MIALLILLNFLYLEEEATVIRLTLIRFKTLFKEPDHFVVIFASVQLHTLIEGFSLLGLKLLLCHSGRLLCERLRTLLLLALLYYCCPFYLGIE
jgi:hypothetical protein